MAFGWHRKVLVVDLIGMAVGAALAGHVATTLVAAAPPPPQLHAERGPKAVAPSAAAWRWPCVLTASGKPRLDSYEVPRTVVDQI